MEDYLIIKALPDAEVGTRVIWDKFNNNYYYLKDVYVSPNDKTFLTAGQVTQTPEFFSKVKDYPESYAYHNPVFSREEILGLLKKYFPNRKLSGQFDISASIQIQEFQDELRKLGKLNAERINKKFS